MQRDPAQLLEDARHIWQAGVDAVMPERLVPAHLRVDGNGLFVGEQQFDLEKVRKIAIVGAGKAAGAMAVAPPSIRGRVAGVLTASIFIGQFLSPLISQPWVDAFGYRAIYHDMGMVYSRRGQYDQARIHYLQAISRDSLFAPSYHNLGNIQLRQGRIEEAIALFRRAIGTDSTYVLSYLALGNTQMRVRQVPQALASYLRGLEIAPDNARLKRNAEMARQNLAAAKKQR